MMKTIKEMEVLIDKILADREHNIKVLEDQLSKDRAGMTKAQNDMDDATNKGDLKAYQRAKADRENYRDAVEMNSNRLDALKKKALISKDDYEKTIKEVYDEYDSIVDASKEKMSALSEEMYQVGMDIQNETNIANKVLRRFQHEIYRDADRSKNADGKIVYFSQETKEVKAWDVVDWAKASIRTDGFKAYTGKKYE